MSNKIIKFSADWCGPCKVLKPAFEEFAGTITDPSIEVIRIDVDEHRDLAASYDVRSVPQILFIKDDQVHRKVVGLRSAEQLQKEYNEVYKEVSDTQSK